MNRKFAFIAVLLVALGAGGWVVWDSQRGKPSEPVATPGTPAGLSVTTAIAQRQTVPVVLEVNGYVASLNSVDIRPQISNVIARVHIKEGQFVKAGDVLFTLDDRTDQVNLLKAEAQLAKDQATLADFERQLARSKELRQKGFIAQSATDTVQTQLEAQQAAVRADQAALEGARVSLGFNTLRAPIAGRVGAISVYPGSLVQPNSAALASVTQLDPISVGFTIPEGELNSLLATSRSGPVTVIAYLPNSDWKREGRLSFIDNAVDSQSGTIRAKGLFANADQALWPGAYAGIRISVRELPDVVVIPLAAVVNAVDGTHIYTVSADQTVQRHKIQILYSFGTQAAIKGIESGMRVVVDGTQNLRPAMRVREAGSGRPAQPGAAGATARPAETKSP
ncbi:MAG: efflux RND transporter periplasmic adaptor subunit [Proteobacteria bacterium]|nr:efflux RND transporter periplasmic adaptor subunit [Pseudomonadota bacterium]